MNRELATTALGVLRNLATRASEFLSFGMRGGLPLLAGIFAAALLFAVSEHGSFGPLPGFLNPNNWSLGSFSIARVVLAFGVLIVANFFTILVSLILYFLDIVDMSNDFHTAFKRGSGRIRSAMFLNIVAILLLVVWFVGFWQVCNEPEEYFEALNIGGRSAALATWLSRSSEIAIAIFLVFSVEDTLLFSAMRSCILQGGGREYQRGVRARMRFALDSILFIDVPSLLGSVLVLWANEYIGRLHIGNGMTSYASILLPRELFGFVGPGAGDHIIHIGSIANDLPGRIAELTAPAALGIAAGSHLMLLIASQIIFFTLNMRAWYDVQSQAARSAEPNLA